MIRVGILGLDTSHPAAFGDLLAERDDATVSAVWDGRDVRDLAYIEQFCETHGATRYDDPMEVADAVDAAMVLTVNWDTHRDLAVPLLEAGIPTFIDKPIAGSLDDLNEIGAAAGSTPLVGGSAVPFHPSLSNLQRGVPDRALYAAGYGDPFYYGVHLTDTARLLAGADWTRVAPSVDPGATVDATFSNGARATLRLDGPEHDAAFGFLDVADRTEAVRIGSGEDELARMYDPLVEAFLAAARDERDDTERLVDAAALLLAVQFVLESGDPISTGDARLAGVHVDGGAFVADYEPYY